MKQINKSSLQTNVERELTNIEDLVSHWMFQVVILLVDYIVILYKEFDKVTFYLTLITCWQSWILFLLIYVILTLTKH